MGILQKKLLIVVLLACGIVVVSFYGFWQKTTDESGANEVSTAPGKVTATNTAATANSAAGSEVVVYVSGGVNKPGVYKLPQGSRIVDAVTAAGGFALGADPAKINLALHLKDEMQVNVPYIITAAGNGTLNSGASAGNSNDKININTASAAELDKLPGIGPSLAERIAQFRTANGPFSDLADLKKVPGIGEAKYNQFKDKISL
ncbi:ComE operon protein 1 [Sporomusa ovata DSM 2662]|uniref:Late competence protein ComEA, DNA receptor n=2 Tax=Sporomusa ovata TaxID=2378 RepID=A0A0U1KXD4_9FIRM|nr:ComEA family DNA-binding protein [Sporomusa ovata]EQB29568.1 competence protein ComEA helix-hairpin-helix repeat protein [Sporomusa ovata DSM 2662]CQR72082.1 Late competence protein ComEA, DNA receptor [Sporomusa ovata]